ncbi:hypothetical protein BBJ28_00008381 [Nothophytophthora sp. Chile5]|nr:hypothetical protein BBJ28_00008381 [Nothophytophthora sp. Chile5]
MARTHLSFTQKEAVQAHHREHVTLSQDDLCRWIKGEFGVRVGRSTISRILNTTFKPTCANPDAKRVQKGRYPEMEQELFAFIRSRPVLSESTVGAQDGDVPVLRDAELWAKANEILKSTRGSDESVSAAWVHRFKKRHGLHRSQLKRAGATAAPAGEKQTEPTRPIDGDAAAENGDTANSTSGKRRAGTREEHSKDQSTEDEALPPTRKKRATAKPGSSRRHFVSADDILLLTQVLATQPWEFPYAMDGWHQVAAKLRGQRAFRLEKTAGACQARLNLLLEQDRADKATALRKAGTAEEYVRKRTLIKEVQAKLTASRRRSQENKDAPASTRTSTARLYADTSPEAAESAAARERIAQRRLELMERKMERELAAQKRHAEEQVKQLETLHREQMSAQQTQHTQLLATIQQQQAMMVDLIKSVAPIVNQSHSQAKDKE